MSDPTHVIAGRCTTRFDGTRTQEQHGAVLVVVKPDNTVLVHDAAGYQPVAWLTRPESVIVTDDRVTASDGTQLLDVEIHDAHIQTAYPTSDAGVPVGKCPTCDGTIVRSRGTVSCSNCGAYKLPAAATVLEEECDDCGLPQIAVERGERFTVCVDRACDSLDERIRTRYDSEWECPECGGDLRVLRRGGLILGCENYPDCETGFAFPTGIHDGTCDCGLPQFETATENRCLDSGCDRVTDE